MGRVKKLPIPSDWTEGDGFTAVFFCIPNSRGWRSIITGMVESLSEGRTWDRSTGTITDVQELGRDIFEGFSMACLDDILVEIAAIKTAIDGVKAALDPLAYLADIPSVTLAINECCRARGLTGQTADDIAPLPVVTVGGPEDQFSSVSQMLDAKCSVANGIYDTVFGIVNWLKENNADVKGGLFVGTATTLVGALIAAGPLGWGVALVAGTVTGIIATILSATAINFADIEGGLTDAHTEIVTGLHSAKNQSEARDSFIDALKVEYAGLTVPEEQLLRYMLNNKVLNQLFAPTDEMAIYVSDNPVVCPGFDYLWTYDSSIQGWLTEDQSLGTQTATMTWDRLSQSIEFNLVLTVGGGASARGVAYLAGLAIDVDTSSLVQADYGPTSDGNNSFQQLIVTYSDTTTQTASSSGTTDAGGTLSITPASAKQIERIDFSVSREVGNYDYTLNLLEVRIRV